MSPFQEKGRILLWNISMDMFSEQLGLWELAQHSLFPLEPSKGRIKQNYMKMEEFLSLHPCAHGKGKWHRVEPGPLPTAERDPQEMLTAGRPFLPALGFSLVSLTCRGTASPHLGNNFLAFQPEGRLHLHCPLLRSSTKICF